jgi:hypothetical protein
MSWAAAIPVKAKADTHRTTRNLTNDFIIFSPIIFIIN